MSYQPRILEKFESSDGARVVTFPLFAYEYESEQSLRNPEADLTGADYAVDLLGTSPGVKNSGRERLRFVNYATTPTAVDTARDVMFRDLHAIGLGKLYSIDSAGVRRWAWARIADMPSMSWKSGDIFKQSMALGFIRRSDWYSTTQRVYQFDLGSDDDTFTVHNNGDAPVRFMQWRLRSQANFRLAAGTAITDATRRANTQGDGEAAGSSFVGAWATRTNLVTNGGLETNTTGWSVGASSTIERSTDQAKFGAASLKCTYVDNTILAIYSITLTAVAHSASVWVYIPTSYSGTQLRVGFEQFTSATGTLTSDPNMSLRDQWQRVVIPNVTPNGADLIGSIRVYEFGSAPDNGEFIYIDGLQVEVGAFPSPYIHTDGGTASRTGADIETPIAGLGIAASPAGGFWAACRVRMQVTDENLEVAGGATGYTVWQWGNSATDVFGLFFRSGSQRFLFRMTDASASQDVNVSAAAENFAAGDDLTLIICWTDAVMKASGNGAAFQSAARARTPAGGGAVVNMLVAHAGADQLNSAMHWCAMGTGIPTDADAAYIHALGNTDPSLDELDAAPSGGLTCTRVWTGDGVGSGTTYYTNPKIVNDSNDDEFSTTRDSTATDDELKVDSERATVERSTDDGSVYANDYSLFSIGATQVGFMRLEEGENDFHYEDGGTPNEVVELRFYEAFN